MNVQLTFIHALSSLHAGIGQGAGVIDLPIAREKATGIPYLPGSSLKGALRTRAKTTSAPHWAAIFGPDRPDEIDNSASLAQFSDQKLLLLPVRSLAGTFAWVTSPYILHRLVRDIVDVWGKKTPPAINVPEVSDLKACHILNNEQACALIPHKEGMVLTSDEKRMVYLEDLDLQAKGDKEVDNWAQLLGKHIFPRQPEWQEILAQRLCVVHDDVFNFLLTTATEIITRIRLEETSKTVTQGGLWYEEALPTETILSGLLLATPSHSLNADQIFTTLENLTKQTIQLGGKATVGRGICRVHLAQEQ